MTALDLSIPDEEDKKLLKGKSPGYIRGWNTVKYRNNTTNSKGDKK